ncbi:MAG: hypothetical protein JWO97_3718, partial [Acidobacteria bacterium]|nr:hypothetical protein [Acidobacteriota bacterium]
MLRRKLTIVFVVIAVIVTAILLFREIPRRIEETLTTPKEQEIDLGAVVTRVRDLNRLETAAMRVTHVSTITQSYKLVPNAMAGDELTLFATGDVIAGVDLSRLTQNDIRREPDGSIVMRLPSPEILISRLDNRETRVITRRTGMFRRADDNLESRARQHADIGIRQEAMKKG